jgi:hypothetical protein
MASETRCRSETYLLCSRIEKGGHLCAVRCRLNLTSANLRPRWGSRVMASFFLLLFLFLPPPPLRHRKFSGENW